ncbi:hypothetical protein GLAREA_10636 [Glarea lozoyensis ATCC 20868]|uniref:Uncharacterized protein n=1 Tax=Glarea lozoyensis (strain ATCC 20868 / MF5171) TaxID=1116229 RepID=S3DSJ9_GLAL2|nr:uncharacterized protein GLAREA_10636 [Glarea lozoyensis ATCC 20868]EPE34941.1 hypothetical protein GLAREA_10636 [Glarea lozoyensis ATCC 20868]
MTHESSLFDLELIKDMLKQPYNLAQRLPMIRLFDQGVKSEAAAVEAAQQLDAWCPPVDQTEEANDFLWNLWEVMLDIARSPEVTTEVHIGLIRILENLRPFARGMLSVYGFPWRLWGGFPRLRMAFEEATSDPTFEGSGMPEFTSEEANIFRNVSYFEARCYGANIGRGYGNLIDAMRSALEEDLSTTEISKVELKMQVACEWILHAANALLTWARVNGDITDLPRGHIQYLDRGTLYHGKPWMCLERLTFWIGRFEDIGKNESRLSEETRNRVLESARFMKSIESSP